MNYTKLSLSLLLVAVTGYLLEARTAQDFRDLKNRMRQEQNAKTVDRNTLKDKYIEEANLLFDLNSLTPDQRHFLSHLKDKCSDNLFNIVAIKPYGSQLSAELDMSKINAECFAGWAEAIARNTAEEQTHSLFGKPDTTIIHNAGNKARKDALERASNKNKGCLRYIVNGTLEDTVRSDIRAIAIERQKIAQKKIDNERAALAAKQVQKKQRTEDDIYEVYPATEDGLTEVRLNLERNLQIREQECCVCHEKYIDLGVRVNLRCRHTICPCCLFENKYKYNRHECPLHNKKNDKGSVISSKDFPVDILVTACSKQQANQNSQA